MVFRVFQLSCRFVSTPKKALPILEICTNAVMQRFQIPCEHWKKPWLFTVGFIANYTNQLHRGYHKPIYGSLLTSQYFMDSRFRFFFVKKVWGWESITWGHYALCGHLLPFLGRSDRPTRVVSVSSLAHRLGNPLRLLQEHHQTP